MVGRRLGLIAVPVASSAVKLLQLCHNDIGPYRSDFKALLGLPVDTDIRGVSTELRFAFDEVVFKVWHADLEEVPEGHVIPYVARTGETWEYLAPKADWQPVKFHNGVWMNRATGELSVGVPSC